MQAQCWQDGFGQDSDAAESCGPHLAPPQLQTQCSQDGFCEGSDAFQRNRERGWVRWTLRSYTARGCLVNITSFAKEPPIQKKQRAGRVSMMHPRARRARRALSTRTELSPSLCALPAAPCPRPPGPVRQLHIHASSTPPHAPLPAKCSNAPPLNVSSPWLPVKIHSVRPSSVDRLLFVGLLRQNPLQTQRSQHGLGKDSYAIKTSSPLGFCF